jgi:hypothetical protein
MYLHYMRHSWIKIAFWEVKTRNDVNCVSLFKLSYLIKIIAYLCSQRTPNIQIKYLDLIDLCTDYFCYIGAGKVSLYKMVLFVYECSRWSIVQLKKRFETWITRNDVNGVSLFHLSYLITLMAHLKSQRTQMSKSSILVWLVYLQTICAK